MQVTAKNLNISYFSSTSEDYESRQIILVGDLIGRLDASGKILDYGSNAQKAIIKKISSTDFNDLAKLDLLDIVGSFSLIVYNENGDLFISVGTASPSAYICPSSDSSKPQITFDENEILINNKEFFASDVISMISQSHQLVARFPDSLFNLPAVKRIPAGHIYHCCSSKTTFRPFIYGSSATLSLHTLKTTLGSIINLYYNFYKGDIGLSYSGGLDSSCIAAQIISDKLSIPFIHLDYHGTFSRRSLLAASLTKFLTANQQDSIHLPPFGKQASVDGVAHTLSNTFLQLPNEMYAGNPYQFYGQHLPKYIITGQGADSLYTIDTFAPPTETIGFKRNELINKTASYRADLTRNSLYRNLNLENNSASFSAILSSSEFHSLIKNHFNSFDEHVPFKVPQKLISHEFTDLKISSLFNFAIQQIALLETTVHETTILQAHRYIKWIRSLINVPNQYHNMVDQQGFKLTPFQEGPIVKLFFAYELTQAECFHLKKYLEDLFTYSTGISHRMFTEKLFSTPNYSKNDFGLKIDSEMSKESIAKFKLKLRTLLRSRLEANPNNKSNSFSLTQLMRISIFS